MDVKTLCLGVLNGGDATGYEIKKQAEIGPFRHFYQAGFGSIYPALNALAADGLIEQVDTQDAGRPGKKIYRITARGRLALIDALSAPPGPDRVHSEALFVLYFAHLLPPRWIDQVLTERLADFRAQLDRLEAEDCSNLPPGARFGLEYGKAMYRAQIEFLEANSHLLVGAVLKSDLAAE